MQISIPNFKGYLGSPKLKRVGIKIDMSKEQVDEYIRCAEDPVYFISSWVKIITLDKGLVNIDLYPFQKEAIELVKNDRQVIIKCGRQLGKAGSLDTPVLTPDGWSTMGDLCVGDYVYGLDGSPTQVTFATETMYNHKCYKVTFDNGEVITADAEHLWNVSYRRNDNVTKTTEELVNILKQEKGGKRGVSIPVSSPIEFTPRNIPIDPYILGLWLGDGHSSSGTITCHVDDYPHYKNVITGFKISEFKPDKRRPTTGRFTIYGLRPLLRKIGVLNNKHIPTDYIFTSIHDRLQIVRGLMDSDGYAMKCGTLEFTQKNTNIFNSFKSIIESLGIKTRKSIKTVDNEPYNILRLSTDKFPLFTLERKLTRQRELQGSYQIKNHYIVSIEETTSVPVRCIQVAAPDHLFLWGKTLIPTHNTTMTVGILLWYILFNEAKTVAILANKAKTAREILNRLKIAYEELPKWIQQGVAIWNKGDIELENKSRVFADSTASTAIRGYSINFLYLDEFAFVPNNIAEDFFSSVYPTISSGETSKILISSTPNGMNHFYKMWTDAVEGRSGFKFIEANWRSIPGRTPEWAENQRKVLGDQKYLQEVEVEFHGSVGTLISAMVLKSLAFIKPNTFEGIVGLSFYDKPVSGRKYVIVADTSRGKGLDYSAFVVVDVTEIPYKVVCTYKDNDISPILFPSIIQKMGKWYNEAYVLIEINDNGQQVVDSLFDDYEYENILSTQSNKKKIILTWSSGGTGSERGIRTTKSVKRLGCSLVKSLIESYKLTFQDFGIISELSTFISKKGSYEADEGSNDDLVMCLVLFAWMTNQPFFSDLCNTNIKEKLYREQMRQIDEQLLPPTFHNGINNLEERFIQDGDVWSVVNSDNY